MAEFEDLSQATYHPNYEGLWKVLVYSDNVRIFDEVLVSIIFATNLQPIEAWKLAISIAKQPQTIIFKGDYTTAQEVATIMRQSKILVEIDEGE